MNNIYIPMVENIPQCTSIYACNNITRFPFDLPERNSGILWWPPLPYSGIQYKKITMVAETWLVASAKIELRLVVTANETQRGDGLPSPINGHRRRYPLLFITNVIHLTTRVHKRLLCTCVCARKCVHVRICAGRNCSKASICWPCMLMRVSCAKIEGDEQASLI